MAAAVLTIDINARLAKLEQGLAQANSGIVKFSRGIEGAGELAKKSLEAIGIGFSVGAIVEGLRAVRDMALEEQRSLAQLNAVLKATGSGAGFTATQLESLGESVKNSSVFDDDDIRKAETALLRFRSVQGEVFEQAIRLTPDVARALGTDLPTAAQALGKALTNPAAGMKALKDAGIDLHDQQRDLAARFIETGDKASAQRIVLDDLAKSVGGASGADNEGAYGASKRLTRAWDDMLKTLGRKIVGDGAVADHLTRSVQALTSDIDKAGEHWKAFLLLLATGPAGASNFQGQVQIDAALEGAKRRTAKGSISEVGTPGADQIALIGKVNSRVGELTDAAYAENKLALKKRADLASTAYAGELGTQKHALDEQLANLEFSYSQGLISTSKYYDEQVRIATEGARNVQVNLGKQGQAQENILNAKIGDTNQNLFSPDERASALQKLEAIGDATGKAGFARDEKLLKLTNERTLALRNLTDEYASLNAQIAESEGDTTKLAGATFDRANRERIAQLKSERDSAAGAGLQVNVGNASRALTQFEILRQQTIAQAGLNDITRDYGRIVDGVGIKQDQIDIEQQRGALTEIDAINRKSDLARQYIPLLNAQIEKFRAIAENQDLPAVLREDALLNVQKMTLEVSRLSLQTDALAKKFNDIGSSAFSTFLSDIATGAKSAKQALLDMFKSVEQSLAKIAADNVSQKLFGKDGPLGGFGDLLGGIFGGGKKGGGADAAGAAGAATATAGVASLGTAATATSLSITTTSTGLVALTAAAQAAATALLTVGTSGGASTLGSAASGLFGSAFDAGSTFGFAPFANGTGYATGGWSRVGERGPEEIYLPRGSRVIPHDNVGRGGDRSGSDARRGSTSITIENINVPANTSRPSAMQTALSTSTEIRRSLGRS